MSAELCSVIHLILASYLLPTSSNVTLPFNAEGTNPSDYIFSSSFLIIVAWSAVIRDNQSIPFDAASVFENATKPSFTKRSDAAVISQGSDAHNAPAPAI